MNISEQVLTGFQADYPPENQTAVRCVIVEAYAKADSLTDPQNDPAFDSPNRSLARGYNRWIILDSFLKRACDSGMIRGVTGHWINLTDDSGGTVWALELRGRYTAMMAHRLQSATASPRESKLRFDRRVKNWQTPFLWREFEPVAANDSLVNLTLIHGSAPTPFAQFRIYDDPSNLKSWHDVSENLMLLPSVVVPAEAEEVVEAEITLNPDLLRKDMEQANG